MFDSFISLLFLIDSDQNQLLCILQVQMQQQEQLPFKRYNNIKPKTFWQKLIRRKTYYTQLLDRSILSNLPDEQLPANKIQTSKYNYFTFFPLNFGEQFTKLSNIYFLFICVLQTIPSISLSEGKPTIALPLIIVVVISMIKDFIEDLKRRKNDVKENQSQVEYLSPVGFVNRKWQDLRVGDIIRVTKDQYFPCDIILLNHSKQSKTAFVETKNLDGQTNLKLKSIPEHLNFIDSISQLDLSVLKIEFSFEKPNPFLGSFNGNVKVRERKYMIDNSNVVLRGCSLKINTYAIGLCVYTGHETKILLNSGIKTRKVTSLQQYLNNYFKYIFLFQLIVTLVSAIVYGILLSINYQNLGYTSQSGSIASNIFFTWGSWFISFSNFIPISLLVTVEIVRYGQGIMLNKDEYCKSKGMYTEVQTSSINQELGQIKYLMTDKTGTLTQNLMEFKCLYVNGQTYGFYKQQKIEQQITDRSSSMPESFRSERQTIQLAASNIMQKGIKIPNVDFSQSQKFRLLGVLQAQDKDWIQVREALLHLCLCHNVITQKNSYTSSSPDQLALVSFAKYIGFQFVQKNDNNQIQVIQRLNKVQIKHKYKLLHTLQFSSQRKRMSVILQEIENQSNIILLCKGADEVILNRVKDNKNQNNKQINKIQHSLFNYACEGLRTLVLAKKVLNEQQYKEWDEKYTNALTIIGPERFDQLTTLQSDIESHFQIVGATAIQDKLQDRVKETIIDLKKSNIKVWMLTGDKKETAISIGFACGLIDKHSERITLDCDADHAKNLILNLRSMMHLVNHKKVTILSGQFIKKIDDETRGYLEEILSESESVICCRVSPKDKEEVTKMVKKWGITLAVGDGANDVNMINSAHVGVGVRGIQGSQATRAADYVITQFKLLRRLIVYHGINFYHRNSNVMLYNLYKNMIVTLPNLIYGTLSMQSGTYIYQIWAIQGFNSLFVSFPIVYYGLFDILYSWRELKQRPYYYIQGQSSAYFNKASLAKQLITTIVMAILVVFIVYFSTESTLSGKGLMIYEQWSGNLILAIVIIVCNLRVISISNQFNIVQGFLCSLGVILYFLVYFLVGIVLSSDSKNTLQQQMSSGIYWLLIIFFSFFIEGVQVFEMTLQNMNKIIQKNTNQVSQPKQIQLIEQERKVEQDQNREQIGGYAFAEDENRMVFQSEVESNKQQLPIL